MVWCGKRSIGSGWHRLLHDVNPSDSSSYRAHKSQRTQSLVRTHQNNNQRVNLQAAGPSFSLEQSKDPFLRLLEMQSKLPLFLLFEQRLENWRMVVLREKEVRNRQRNESLHKHRLGKTKAGTESEELSKSQCAKTGQWAFPGQFLADATSMFRKPLQLLTS